MTTKRDKQNRKESAHSRAEDNCDVTPLCTHGNVVSLPTRTSRNAELEAFRRSIKDLSSGELKRRYPGEYNCWRAMKQRARAETCSIHPDMESFRGFLAALGPMPKPTMTVDRIDNDRKEYAPDNVRWATKRKQANNRSNTIILTDEEGVSLPLTEWAKATGQKSSTLRQRHSRGWSDVEVIKGKRGNSGSTRKGSGKAYWPVPNEEKQAWEHAYQRLLKHYRYHPGFTRPVFLAWMVQNRAYWHNAYLERRYPDEIGTEANPYGDPIEAPKDLRYLRWQKCLGFLQETLPEVRKNKHEREMIDKLWRRRDRPFQPWNIE